MTVADLPVSDRAVRLLVALQEHAADTGHESMSLLDLDAIVPLTLHDRPQRIGWALRALAENDALAIVGENIVLKVAVAR